LGKRRASSRRKARKEVGGGKKIIENLSQRLENRYREKSLEGNSRLYRKVQNGKLEKRGRAKSVQGGGGGKKSAGWGGEHAMGTNRLNEVTDSHHG